MMSTDKRQSIEKDIMTQQEAQKYLESIGFIYVQDSEQARKDSLAPHLKKCKNFCSWTLADASHHNVKKFIPSCHQENNVKKFSFLNTSKGLQVKHWSYTLKKRGELSYYDFINGKR